MEKEHKASPIVILVFACFALGCGSQAASSRVDADSSDGRASSEGALPADAETDTAGVDGPRVRPADVNEAEAVDANSYCQDTVDAPSATYLDAPAFPLDGEVDVGTPCLSSACDDGNPCTTDSVDTVCACAHAPLAEGTPCDDGDACTEHDACFAGVCKGTKRASTLAVLGTLRSYASGPSLETVVAFPSQERAVFLTTNRLTLVKIDGDSLTVLDRAEWGSRVSSFQVSPTIWASRPRTLIIPLSRQRIAVIGANWSIDLYDIGQDRLQPSYRYGFGGASQDMLSAAVADGQNIWTCIGNWVQRYEVDDVRGLVRQNPGFTIPGSHSCFGLALSPDGSALLAATSQGLDVIDISRHDGSGILSRTVLAGDFLLDVVSNGKQLGVYRLDQITSGLGAVLALDAATLTPIATFANTSTMVPMGIAALDQGFVVEKWNQGTCREVEAEFYRQAASANEPTSRYLAMSACRARFGLPPAVLAGAGQLLDLPPMHQVVRVDGATGRMTPLRGLEQGSFAHVLPGGTNLVEVHGPSSMHVVDVSQPASPNIRSGGLFAPMKADWLRVELSNSGRASMLTVPRPEHDLTRAGPKVSLLWENPGALPTLAGSLANDDANAQWAAAGTYLYAVSPKGTSDFRLRRFAVRRLTRDEDQVPTADPDQTLPSTVPAALDRRMGEFVAADAASGDVIVAEVRAGTADRASVLTWYAWDTTGFRSLFARQADSGSVRDAGILGARAVLVFGDRALLVDRSGATLATYVHPTGELQRLLSFDARYIYLSGTAQDQRFALAHQVFVLDASDLSRAGQYTMPEPVLSSAVVGNLRVFGMASTLAVTSPVCSQ